MVEARLLWHTNEDLRESEVFLGDTTKYSSVSKISLAIKSKCYA